MSEEQDSTNTRINPKLLRFIQVILMAITVFLLVSHVLMWSAIQVDSITLAFVGFLLLIPLADLVRKIKLGDFEAEIGRAEVAKVQAKAAVEFNQFTEEEQNISENQVRDLLRNDPRLAMAKIRIELEESLKRLYSASINTELDLRKTSLGRIADILVQKQVLSAPVASSIRDVIALANRAVHGERVEASAAEELAILGVRLVHEIQQAYFENVLKPLQKDVITKQVVNLYRSARYRVTTIVPLVENPVKNIYEFDQEALESFLDGYEEYAEFIVSIEKI